MVRGGGVRRTAGVAAGHWHLLVGAISVHVSPDGNVHSFPQTKTQSKCSAHIYIYIWQFEFVFMLNCPLFFLAMYMCSFNACLVCGIWSVLCVGQSQHHVRAIVCVMCGFSLCLVGI